MNCAILIEFVAITLVERVFNPDRKDFNRRILFFHGWSQISSEAEVLAELAAPAHHSRRAPIGFHPATSAKPSQHSRSPADVPLSRYQAIRQLGTGCFHQR
jgi:hypothetical protein